MKNPRFLLLLTLLFPVIIAFPLKLDPVIPAFPLQPNLELSETHSYVHAKLTHPILNNISTARITLSQNPLVVHIVTSKGRSISRRITLKKTYNDVAFESEKGAVILHFRKRVPDIQQAIRFCGGIDRAVCLKRLAATVCLASRRVEAMERLPCGDGCVKRVLENCQVEYMWAVEAALFTKMVFGLITSVILLVYGWGFLLAIISIPNEIVHLVSWVFELSRRIRMAGFKNGFWEELMRFVEIV